MYTSLAIKTKS